MFALFGVTPVIYRADLAQCFERARLKCELKYETLAGWLGWSRTRLNQFLTGQCDLGFNKLLRLSTHQEGRAFLEAFLNEVSIVTGLRHWDGVVSELFRLTNAVQGGLRMAKASIQPAEEKRDIA